MDSKNKTKRHHYVPRCYLSKFLTGDHIYTLDIKNVLNGYKERPKMRHPNSICVDDQYYTIKSEHHGSNFRLDYYDELFVECDVLHELENRYHKIFTALTTSNSLPMTEAQYFCDFIIQMKIRNPYWTNEVIEKNKDSWIDQGIEQIITEKASMNEHFNRLPEQLRQFVIEGVRAEQKGMKTFSKQMQLFSLIQRSEKTSGSRNEKYREVILNNSWMLLESPSKGPYFITSDNPGFGKTTKGLIHNTCFGTDSAFYLPISPMHCLIINGFKQDNAYSEQQSSKQLTLQKISYNKVIQINDHTIQRINRLLIACDSWYIEQIADLNRQTKGTV